MYGVAKWYTVNEYVNIETGEILTKSEIERGNYIRTGKTEKSEYNKNYNVKKITYEYKDNRQTRLEL